MKTVAFAAGSRRPRKVPPKESLMGKVLIERKIPTCPEMFGKSASERQWHGDAEE
jgi:hypothetical protein